MLINSLHTLYNVAIDKVRKVWYNVDTEREREDTTMMTIREIRDTVKGWTDEQIKRREFNLEMKDGWNIEDYDWMDAIHAEMRERGLN